MSDRARALVALDGTLPSREVLEELRSSHGMVVAADGAAVKLFALDIVPDITIGDLDSIAPFRDILTAHGSMMVLDPDQERGDFDKALRWITANGATAATIVGIDGGMIDHALNNFSVLARHARSIALEIRSGEMIGRCVVDRFTFTCAESERVSLIPLPSARVTTSGLAWALEDETLAIGTREGASNRAIAETVTIEVHDGVVIVIRFAP